MRCRESGPGKCTPWHAVLAAPDPMVHNHHGHEHESERGLGGPNAHGVNNLLRRARPSTQDCRPWEFNNRTNKNGGAGRDLAVAGGLVRLDHKRRRCRACDRDNAADCCRRHNIRVGHPIQCPLRARCARRDSSHGRAVHGVVKTGWRRCGQPIFVARHNRRSGVCVWARLWHVPRLGQSRWHHDRE